MNGREYREILFNSELSPWLRLLYSYLRSCADYRSGIAGDAQKKRISYQGIREALEFLPPARSHDRAELFGNKRIYHMLRNLSARGYIVELSKESPTPGRRQTVRYFLPLVVGASVCLQDERDMSETHERDAAGPVVVGFAPDDRDAPFGDERDTSVSYSLPLNNFKIFAARYEPDPADETWLRYVAGHLIDCGLVDPFLETEKFRTWPHGHLKPGQTTRDLWRMWMLRAVDHARKELKKG